MNYVALPGRSSFKTGWHLLQAFTITSKACPKTKKLQYKFKKISNDGLSFSRNETSTFSKTYSKF